MSHIRIIILILVRCHRTASNVSYATLENIGSPRLQKDFHMARESRLFGTAALISCMGILLEIHHVKTGITLFCFGITFINY